MSSVVHDEEGFPRFFGFYTGIVFDNADPQKRGRVKVEIPGLAEPSTNWALPIGGSHSSGEANRGGFDPPKKDAAVVVAFLDGDPDHPVYLGGWRAVAGDGSDAPTTVNAASPADAANKIKAYETDAYEFVVDETGKGPVFTIRHKASDTRVVVRDTKIEVVCGDRILRVKDGKIQLGDKAAEALVLGTTWWREQQAELQGLSAGLDAAAAGCVGVPAPLAPGLSAASIAVKKFLQFGSNDDAFLSKVSFTEKDHNG